MTIASVTRDTDAISYVEDGITKKLSIRGAHTVFSFPPTGGVQVYHMYIDGSGNLVVQDEDQERTYGEPGVGAGDMLKSTYDIDASGVVDNADKLDGSTKAEVQDHTPKAHTLASHSTKAHSELTGVGASDHHTKYTDAEALAAALPLIVALGG